MRSRSRPRFGPLPPRSPATRRLGACAAEILLRRIANPETRPETIVLPTVYEDRASAAPAPSIGLATSGDEPRWAPPSTSKAIPVRNDVSSSMNQHTAAVRGIALRPTGLVRAAALDLVDRLARELDLPVEHRLTHARGGRRPGKPRSRSPAARPARPRPIDLRPAQARAPCTGSGEAACPRPTRSPRSGPARWRPGAAPPLASPGTHP